MNELKIKLENLQRTLADPVSNEDLHAAWFMVEEIINDIDDGGTLALETIEQQERVGDERIIKRFLFMPRTIGGTTKWLETATIIQRAEEYTWYEDMSGTGLFLEHVGITWRDKGWGDKEDISVAAKNSPEKTETQ